MVLFRPRERRSAVEWSAVDALTPSVTETLALDRRLSPAGIYITPEVSIQKIAVFASANLIAQTVTQLPIDLFRGTGSKKQELAKPPLLLDPSGEGYGFADWAWEALFRCLLEGNAVGYMDSVDAFGFPTSISLQPLNYVTARYTSEGTREWRIRGVIVPTERVFHLRAYPVERRILGLSPIGLHMRTIGIGLQAEEFGANFYRDGGHPTGILTSEGRIEPEQAASVKAKFMAALRGSRGPVVLPNNIKYQAIQVSPAESQFLETQKYSSAECARIFGPGVAETLGYETGESMTYKNVESRLLHLLILVLNAWAKRFEDALSSPRITPRGQYVKFNRKALLQAVTLDRFHAHEVALKNGFETINEVRETEDMTPVPWGDEPFTPAITAPAAAAAPAP